MRAALLTLCLSLSLTGCQAPSGGLFGQTRIPSPGTQPPGSLLADNYYYPTSNPGVSLAATQPVTRPAITSSAPNGGSFATNQPASAFDPGPRHGSRLTNPTPVPLSRSMAPGSRE